MINITATVLREGRQREIPLEQIVPGDVVVLAAGDMVPADVACSRRRTCSSARRV